MQIWRDAQFLYQAESPIKSPPYELDLIPPGMVVFKPVLNMFQRSRNRPHGVMDAFHTESFASVI